MMTAEKLCKLIQKTEKVVIPSGMTYPGDPRPPIVCADGFKVSVQACRWTYCTPRQDKGPWTHVEVGFPSEREEALMPYVEDESRPTDTVYGYVPIEIVVEVINRHGGAL